MRHGAVAWSFSYEDQTVEWITRRLRVPIMAIRERGEEAVSERSRAHAGR